MTTYTAIPDGDIDPDSPGTTGLFTLLRDNPLALFEGASGAPRLARGALVGGLGHRMFFDYGDGSDGAVTDSADRTADPGLYQYTTYQLDLTYTLDLSSAGALIICASTSIVINGTIDVDGQGAKGGRVLNDGTINISASKGHPGVFGGSGGAGAGGEDGGDTFMNVGVGSGVGAAQGQPAIDLAYASMAFNTSTYLGGGGGGAGQSGSEWGGDGGGLVVLIAPVIQLGASSAITADGTNGAATGGGSGGGGAIIIATPSGGLTDSGCAFSYAGGTGGNDGGSGFQESIVI